MLDNAHGNDNDSGAFTTTALTSVKQMITGMLSYLDFACFLKSFLSRLIPLFSGALQVIATRQNMLSNCCDINLQSILVICHSNNAFERCIKLLMTYLSIPLEKKCIMMKHSQGFYRIKPASFSAVL